MTTASFFAQRGDITVKSPQSAEKRNRQTFGQRPSPRISQASAFPRLEREVATTDGRKVLVRVCLNGEAIQVAIIGKRGSMVEAVSFDQGQLAALVEELEGAGAEAERLAEQEVRERSGDLLAKLAAAERALGPETHCPNGHELIPENTYGPEFRKGCRTCRREQNYWWRKERGLT